MNNVYTGRASSQIRMSSAVNSGPLSDRMWAGTPRVTKSSASVSSTSIDRNHRATTIARHSREYSSTDGEDLQRPAVMRAVRHEVIRPDGVPILRTLANARAIRKPQPGPFWLFLRHFEAFSPPESFVAFVIHHPALPAQEPDDAPIPILRGQLDEARDQPGFVVRDDRPMPMRRPRLTEHSTSPPLRDAQPVLDLHHGRASPGRAQKFSEATSFRIMLSSAWSATSFFSCVFSYSSAFRRFAWSRRNPPYSFRQRWYVYLLTPSFLQTWGVRRPRPNSTSAWRNLVTICSVLYRLRGILPPGRCARILTLGLERFQGARSALLTTPAESRTFAF